MANSSCGFDPIERFSFWQSRGKKGGMNDEVSNRNRRILIIDDTESIHIDIRRILDTMPSSDRLDAATAGILGEEASQSAPRPRIAYEIDSAYQGQEGVQSIISALGQGQRYAMAFVDMRMPPGWDGVETIERIWKEDPDIQIVICTAYSDLSW